MTSSQLRIFVSSRMQELAPERLAIKTALEELKVDGWVFEEDAGARSQTIQQTYLEELEKSDLYIGLFWRGYGKNTIEEYEHARRHGKDCLIYEKRVDLAGTRDPQLDMWLARVTDVQKGVTPKWFDTSEELKEIVKEDVARWQAEIVRRNKVFGAPVAYRPPQSPEDPVRKELLILLHKVEQFWIKGVLENSVHHQVLIELGKKRVTEAVAHPWESVLELPNQDTAPGPTSGGITDWFAAVDRYLLILGEPGSGKTTTLLELARDLIADARQDTQPIPTIFNLSTWTSKDESMVDWMVRELKEKYQVPKNTARMWLDHHLILPLLDGLDEVSRDLQTNCVNAINEFVQEYPSGLVVCSRLQEYTSLPVRLKLNGAICLQPLTLQQADEYLGKVGPTLAALRAALKRDDNLQELIKTPLMLSIMSLAYEDQLVTGLERINTETVENLRGHVFDTYIARMVQRKGKAGQFYGKERLNTWLGWLARGMKLHSQSIFLIENLQADWLRTRRHRFCYILMSRLLAGLFIGLGLGIAGWMIDYNDHESMRSASFVWVIVTVSGLLLGLISAGITCVKEALKKRVGIVRRATGVRYLIFDIGIYAMTWVLSLPPILALLDLITPFLFSNEDILTLLPLGLIIGLIHWFLFEARFERQRATGDITMVETLSWSWTHALKSGLKGTVLVALILLPFSSLYAKREADVNLMIARERIKLRKRNLLIVEREMSSLTEAKGKEWNDLNAQRASLEFEIARETTQEQYYLSSFFARAVVSISLSGAVIGAMAGFLFGGFKEGIIERKTKPNQGVRLTIRNAIIGGVTLGPLIAVIIGLILLFGSPSETSLLRKLLFVTEVAIIIGLPVAFRNGVYDVIKHYSLRAVLLYCHHIPQNYIKFLNHAVALILLQKVGGGYIFIHRTLLEHYAAIYGADNKLAHPAVNK